MFPRYATFSSFCPYRAPVCVSTASVSITPVSVPDRPSSELLPPRSMPSPWNLLTISSNFARPSLRYLVTLDSFILVSSFDSLSLALSRATAMAVIMKRVSRGPSTSSRIADSAWSYVLRGSVRRTRV
jgi:hypothetical protein